MKTIVETNTGLSKYLLADDVVITASESNIEVGNPIQFVIGDLNSSNATITEGVTAPEDWAGNKYTFDGTDWTLNQDWVDPATLV